ncbi:cell envelope integrity/translocation protein TolA [Bartonella henselae]|nr:cell envelope integrity/translocation protein TolA [Bartonella henselae]ATP12912.1 cell envelope biogenesis protein TolA [Bartonella henselae]PNM39021.1 cell envelope biogenesis protein TolA [Bartonella henselae str. Houston-1]UAK83905.1 cell envelope biogenesis protein TolA [Bartonella henselae]UJM36954.1 cell envelope biogenesis protein TolA [Bartonella henselae]UJM39501.1 cell envelope biogenesis protein TolA [Bartonella henselae]
MNRDSYHSMKRGLALSLVVHVIFLSWGSIYFTNPVSLPQQLEAVPIILAPVTEEFASQQGALNAPVRAIPAVKPTTKPQEKEDARHFGEGQIDSLAPFKPKEKPRSVETTPSSSGEEKASEKSLPVIREQELRETKAEKVSEKPLEVAEKIAPASPEEVHPEVAEKVASETVQQTHKNQGGILPQDLASTEKKVPGDQATRYQQLPKIALPEKFPFPQFKPKPVKESAVQNAQAVKKQNQRMKEKTIEDVLAMEENNLLNHARSQGGGAKRSSELESLGARKNINDTTKMAQTLVSIAGGCIQKKLKLVALGGDLKNRPVVRLRFYLNREGMIMGDPIIDPLSGEQSQQAIMIRQVYAAVFSCQPYTDLPRDQYDLWGQGFDFNVDPLQEIIR